MSMDAIKVIRDAEKAAEAAEKKAKEDAASIISSAHEKAKEFVTEKVTEAKKQADSSLTDTEALNDAFLKKAETSILEEVSKLRSSAEAKMNEVVAEVNDYLF